MPLDEWEEWAAIHLGELLPDGRPRFRVVLMIIARQNGKSFLAKVLILYWLFLENLPGILGTSTDRSYAKRAWSEVCELAKENPWLRDQVATIRLGIAEETLKTVDGAEYKFAANNRRAGRSMTLHRWVCDELREHGNWDAWNAASHAQNAVATAQTVCITNMGDDNSVVLDSLREAAVEYIETNGAVGDARLGLFEWSAPAGSMPTDLAALAMANPNLGRPGRIDPDALLGAAQRAERAGGEELARFRTEVMCIRVDQLDPAIDPDRWAACGTGEPIDLADHRDRLALCLDVALDGTHASLVGAALVDGRVHIEVIEQWHGFGCTKALRADLPGIVAKVRPRRLGWFPAGPAAAVAASMAAQPRAGWPPRRVELADIKAEVVQVCMGLSEQVNSGQVVHPRDQMLNEHASGSQKLNRGDGWVFARRGSGPIDGIYAAAGAVHLARTLPPPRPALVVA
jgi:hypothetical protein